MNSPCLHTQQWHNTLCPPRKGLLWVLLFLGGNWKPWGHPLWWGEWSCTYLSSLQACPTSIPAGGSAAAGPSLSRALVSLTGSARPQQAPSPQMHPKTCPGMRPEHQLTRAWLRPGSPSGIPQDHPQQLDAVQAAGCSSPKRDTDICYFPSLTKRLHHRPGAKPPTQNYHGGVRGEAPETPPDQWPSSFSSAFPVEQSIQWWPHMVSNGGMAAIWGCVLTDPPKVWAGPSAFPLSPFPDSWAASPPLLAVWQGWPGGRLGGSSCS